MALTIPLPCGFILRDYQLPVWVALQNGVKRAITVWHRRSGKDLTALNFIINQMFPTPENLSARIGTYYHMFPTYAQGKRIIWDGRTDEGRAFLSYFPTALFPTKMRNETEMRIEAINGSAYQIIGTDKLDAIVGTNQVGCVLSEYSLGYRYKQAKDLILPILIQNHGWMWFIYTFRGHNHGWDLWDQNKDRPGWFAQLLDIDMTKRRNWNDPDGVYPPVVTKEQFEQAIAEGMDPDIARQEFYCSPETGMAGAYFSHMLAQAEKENRVGRGMYEPLLPVDTWWDIGVDDATAIWFSQQIGKEIRLIDYIEGQGEGLPYYAGLLAEKRMTRRYIYGSFNFPWDMNVKEFGTGKTRLEQARAAKFNPARTVKRLSKIDQISAVRAILPKCWFDTEYCKEGIESLRNFHKTYDEGRKVYLNEPVHDWSSHGASAFMVLAVGVREDVTRDRPNKAETEFDPYTYDKMEHYGDRQEKADTEFNVFA